MRRRALLNLEVTNFVGNTSACAEKRKWHLLKLTGRWKYLRVCGEEPILMSLGMSDLEIPPRVRRRVFLKVLCGIFNGNTSACAEKSKKTPLALHCHRKYLRVCGEELLHVRPGYWNKEIPPRVRRRAPIRAAGRGRTGNTSACAEKR